MGIGQAIATSLAQSGANLILFSRSEVDKHDISMHIGGCIR